ncbi:VanZ family protein [Priestia filamentosa]|uniref:VanZ family protein n=1 Tax=Priestia filamentosa TaxID=1402861 RepID=UPI000A0832BC|nr:VanZ family protein [Priestia filamentosa]MDT3765842.1 VanZ family protein [Priestia filamentosa]OXS65285.1 hypothetical protein B1B01_23405 [Priestia filamentosa]SMF70060.1 VanZ like family protein [Priestia filamentosa]
MKEFDTYIEAILKESKLSAIEQGELYLELHDHLTNLKKEYMEQGLTEEEAVQIAIKSFGEPNQLGHEIYKTELPFQKYIPFIFWGVFIPYAASIVWFFLINDRVLYFNGFDYAGATTDIQANFSTIKIIGIDYYLHSNLNLIPFKTIMMYVTNFDHYSSIHTWYSNTIGNVIPFIPFGFLAPLLFKRAAYFKTGFLLFITPILGIEIIQFLSLTGVFDIDDIILNMMGVCIGYLIWNLTKKVYVNKRENRTLKTV